MSDDIQSCEHCEKLSDIETMSLTGDGCWMCESCHAEFRKAFNECDHKWEPGDNDGDEGQFCRKCCAFVRNEDMPLISPTPAESP